MELPPEQENVAGVVSPHQQLAVFINCIHQIILKLHIKYLQIMRWCDPYISG